MTVIEALAIIADIDLEVYTDDYIWENLGEYDAWYLAYKSLEAVAGSTEYSRKLQRYQKTMPSSITIDQLWEAIKYFDARTDNEWIWRGDDYDYDRTELEDYWGYDNERGSTLCKYLDEVTNADH